jgi:ATP-dependent RNA helicase DDX21
LQLSAHISTLDTLLNTSQLQVEPPKDPETYIHRSGRTGRAGHTGVCVTMVGRKHEDRIPYIEKKAGFKFERVGAPQPAEMAGIAADRALEMLRDVDKATVPWFKATAEAWLAEVRQECYQHC